MCRLQHSKLLLYSVDEDRSSLKLSQLPDNGKTAFPLQTCTFRIDYTLENIPGREFGSVFVGTASENLALRVVSEGWAKVRQIPS